MKKTLIPLVLSGALLCSSCDVVQGVLGQVADLANLANCEYSLKNIDNVSVAGVNLKNVSNGNVSAIDVVKLSAALVSKNIPLAMDMNINVKNPTEKQAALSHLDWALDIEESQFATGAVDKNYTIEAKKTSVVPLAVGTDLYSLFSQKGIESLKSFAGSFTSNGTSSKVGLRIKPSLTVAGQTFKAPNFINITKNVGGGSSTTTSSSQTVKKASSSSKTNTATHK